MSLYSFIMYFWQFLNILIFFFFFINFLNLIYLRYFKHMCCPSINIFFVGEFILLCCLLIILGFSVYYFSSIDFCVLSKKKKQYYIKSLVFWVCDVFQICLFIVIFSYLLSIYVYIYTSSVELLGGLFVFDMYSQITKIFILLLFLLSLSFWRQFLLIESRVAVELPFLLGFSLFFSLILLCSYDFILMYFAIDILALCITMLLAISFGSAYAAEAAIKYFILGSLASGIGGFGIFWIYAVLGNLNFLKFRLLLFETILLKPENLNVLEMSVFFIAIAFLIKLGAFPFNLWVPDVYSGCNLPLFFYFVLSLKSVFILVLVRLLVFVFFDFYYIWKLLILISATGCFLIGSLGAYCQKTLKRFFAYASLNQLGFILLGLACNTSQGFTGTLFFIVVYICNNLLFFVIILTLVNVINYRSITYLSELKGIAFFYPLEAVGLSVAVFSFIGVPPVLGFCSKYFILLITTKIGFFFSLIVSILSNALSAFYYLRILKFIWLERAERLRNYSYFFINCAQNNNRIMFLWCIISFIFCFWFLVIEYLLDFCYFIILRLRLPANTEEYVNMFDLSTLINYTFIENKDVFDDSLWIWFNMGSPFSAGPEAIIKVKPPQNDYLCSLARGTFFHKKNINDFS